MQQDVFQDVDATVDVTLHERPRGEPWRVRAPPRSKRFVALSLEVLKKHREALDATYASGIQVFEQASRVTDVKSPRNFAR